MPLLLSRITRDLIDPRLSFIDVADRNNISFDELTLLLARPDIQEQMQRLDNSLAARARRIATHCLPAVALALDRIVAEFNADAEPPGPVNNNNNNNNNNNTENNDSAGTISATNIPDPEHRRRAAETVRRAGNLLLRIARFQPTTTGVGRASRPPDIPRKTRGFQSLGPAPAATRAPTPTPDDIDEPSAPPRQAASYNRDSALIQELAFNRRFAARILDEILPRPSALSARRPREPDAAPTNNTAPSQPPPQNTGTEPKAPTEPPARSPSNPPAPSPTLPLDHSAALPLPSASPRDFPTPPLLSRIPDPLSPLPLDRFTAPPLDHFATLPLLLPPTPASRLIAAVGAAVSRTGPAP